MNFNSDDESDEEDSSSPPPSAKRVKSSTSSTTAFVPGQPVQDQFENFVGHVILSEIPDIVVTWLENPGSKHCFSVYGKHNLKTDETEEHASLDEDECENKEENAVLHLLKFLVDEREMPKRKQIETEALKVLKKVWERSNDPMLSFFNKWQGKGSEALRKLLQAVQEAGKGEPEELPEEESEEEESDEEQETNEENDELKTDDQIPEFLPQLPLECNVMFSSDNYPEEIKKTHDLIKIKPNGLGDCRFDIRKLLSRLYHHLQPPRRCPGTIEMLGGGRTQLGKTKLKSVASTFCCLLGYTCIIMTTTSANTIDLDKKFRQETMDLELEAGKDFPETINLKKPLTTDGRKMSKVQRLDKVRQLLFNDSNFPTGGRIILLYNHHQIDEILELYSKIPKDRRRDLVIFLDEADEMFKNDEISRKGTNDQEKSLKSLLGRDHSELTLTPALIFYVTATLLPIIVEICLDDNNKNKPEGDDFIVLQESDAYMRAEDMDVTKNNEVVHLKPNSLKWTNQYMDATMVAFIDEAIGNPVESNFLIDITSSRMEAEGGIFQKLEVLSLKYNHNFLGIAITGRGIHLFSKNKSNSRENFWSNPKEVKELVDLQYPTVSNVIDYAQKELNWKGHIVVSGFSMMFRGVSIRGSSRVPTHIAAYLTPSASMETVIQAIGRGTGNMKSLLGGKNVRLLCLEEDHKLILNYPVFLECFSNQFRNYGDIEAALRKALYQIPLHQICKRSVGSKFKNYLMKAFKRFPELLPPIPEHIDFEETIKSVTAARKQLKKYQVPEYSSSDSGDSSNDESASDADFDELEKLRKKLKNAQEMRNESIKAGFEVVEKLKFYTRSFDPNDLVIKSPVPVAFIGQNSQGKADVINHLIGTNIIPKETFDCPISIISSSAYRKYKGIAKVFSKELIEQFQQPNSKYHEYWKFCQDRLWKGQIIPKIHREGVLSLIPPDFRHCFKTTNIVETGLQDPGTFVRNHSVEKISCLIDRIDIWGNFEGIRGLQLLTFTEVQSPPRQNLKYEIMSCPLIFIFINEDFKFKFEDCYHYLIQGNVEVLICVLLKKRVEEATLKGRLRLILVEECVPEDKVQKILSFKTYCFVEDDHIQNNSNCDALFQKLRSLVQ